MAGHSKFKNIQFRKDRQDEKRSKLFSKLSRDITLAAKQGLPDPAANARLRLAIANAKAESMPKDNIDRAIKKAQGGDADTYEEIRYEGFGPGGVGLIVEVLTDNRNRAAANVRTALRQERRQPGRNRLGGLHVRPAGPDRLSARPPGREDEVMEAAIEAGAEDVESDEDGHVIYTAFEDLGAVVEALEAALGAGQVHRHRLAAQDRDARSASRAAHPDEADRRPGRRRRRPERLDQRRHHRRGHGPARLADPRGLFPSSARNPAR